MTSAGAAKLSRTRSSFGCAIGSSLGSAPHAIVAAGGFGSVGQVQHHRVIAGGAVPGLYLPDLAVAPGGVGDAGGCCLGFRADSERDTAGADGGRSGGLRSRLADRGVWADRLELACRLPSPIAYGPFEAAH
jgi:hypothetical protein